MCVCVCVCVCVKAVHQLYKLIKRHSKTNMHKFELYALKNIFATASPESSSSSSTTSTSSTSRQRDAAFTPSAALDDLRMRYAELTARNNYLREEAAASESLLNQMNSTIFDLRVGAQVLDAYEVKPLADTVSGVSQWHKELVQLSDRARCKFHPRHTDFFYYHYIVPTVF